MRIISHRGNLAGPDFSKENDPEQIEKCLGLGFDCEVDLRMLNGDLFLGHDRFQFEVSLAWLTGRADRLWIHCKDSEALFLVSQANLSLNFFWHETDKHAITSQGVLWNFPGGPITSNSIAVLPELWWQPTSHEPLHLALGICTDFPIKFRETLGST